MALPLNIYFKADTADKQAVKVLPVKEGFSVSELPDFSDEARALITLAAKNARFTGKEGSLLEVVLPEKGNVRQYVLVGFGNDKAYDKAGAAVVARFLTSGLESLAIDLAAVKKKETAKAAASFAYGAVLRGYKLDNYRTTLSDDKKPSLKSLYFAEVDQKEAEKAWQPFSALAEGILFTRMLVTEPGNILYPESFVEHCKPLAEIGLSVEILDEAALREAGMGALLGVAQGSARSPRLLALRWNGTGKPDSRPVAFVGKGVTFDSGGISLKPGAGMEGMKWDMGGAGAVVGVMKALALRKAKADIIGVCGLVENMPDANAQRPGDVVKTMSGQTVEVINTDAEGRLVLCDVLTWVQKNYKPEVIIDLATLTGAMIISLGHEYGGLFSNCEKLADNLVKAGRSSGDALWRLPMGDAYDKLLDSHIADMKNVGPRYGGSITAAQFLKRFIDKDVRWAHLDIAGMVWADKADTFWDKGATGYGVRLLNQLVSDNFEK
ncbi:MAG: leucyl aminopeptidase [Zymomonas mobilis subsp. pomaceae]|uniref:Probable cytosol aminopeptidase n=1 Tax=Zymomonas mobilis subsp. pomaceae (strain ATCC 29192 / DSM 22645 / JCM 10191 / CCUG 17912 / NBRC 13757 / NCIMB 11200 / NRRL B-4491 / Barker I) TaxID=579138 RepID=F8ET44_ZYMMT|nr:leucyl aminopeptidase [Zymomonas mobilis]AEI36934.1 Leucyl aminopeptidase [Zymomonas mobilis subsp. pomaceae ATCC 29192]MDX5948307.1 leucyl aminopeptidase [Zymomonas mobilis subsp. pomaceae]